MDPDEGPVILSTIHSAKGLGMAFRLHHLGFGGKVPSFYNINTDEELEEERRLLYVAATRAKENLFISVTRSRSSTADYAWSSLVPLNSSRVFPKTCSSRSRLSMRKEIGVGSLNHGAISAQCRRVREWGRIDES